ncbi:MAG: rhomboid family intramembrane serine protease [Bacteroidetes bacterium]|nr:rhomboid family intramembrane serine protease [Bacteroidota bacterium]MBS1935497.1 rhomboid family intramembrane serine protease [Bacteroidota bacterium]
MDVMEDSYRKKMGLGQDGNALIRLIVLNAVLFVVLKFIYIIYVVGELDVNAYYKNIFNWFILPADIEKLAIRPWAIVTYIFTDFNVLKFVANMLWLWGFGYIMQDLTGNRKLIPIYIYGAFAAAFFYILSYYIFPKLQSQIPSAAMYGAAPGVMAIAVATTTLAPDYRIFPMINGGIPLWVLTLIYILINFSSIAYGDSGAYIANVTAGGMGFFFIYQMRRGNDLGAWMNNFFDWCNDLFDPEKKQKKKPGRDEFYYNVSGTQPYKKIPNITQKRIDDILDKINQQGYRFLTDEEKDILKRAADKEDL